LKCLSPYQPLVKASTCSLSYFLQENIGCRFHFNGIEKCNEVYGQGNSYIADYRNHDSRLGKWLSIDPEEKKFPSQSPYISMSDNPILRIDPLGNSDDEFKEVNNQDGTSTTTKVSNLGGDKVDFTHIEGGEHDGQTKIRSRETRETVYMNSSAGIANYTQRGTGISWYTIYEELLTGNGPENSLITNPGMLQDIMKSPQFGEAVRAYLDANAPEKMGYKPSFGIPGAVKAGNNMTAQMIGKANYSFYNVGDNLVITIMDSKSVMSYSFNPLVKMLPEDWVNNERKDGEVIPESTTRQTYILILPIKKK
jgi:hypothetical protein